MKITFKLYAGLQDYLPANARDNAVEIDLPDSTTVKDVTEKFQLPPKLLQIVLVNGVFLTPEQRTSQALQDGDVLAIWPPVAGG